MIKLNFSKYELAIATLAGILLVFSLSGYVKLTFDSRLYISGAEFIQHNGLNNLFNCPTFFSKPPLYPLLLSIIGTSSLHISVFNGLCFICLLWTGFSLVDKFFEEGFISKILKFHLAFATPYFLVHQFVWTEPLFLLLLNIYFLVILNAKKEKSIYWVIKVISIGILIIGLRHVGIFFVFSAAIYIGIFEKRQGASLIILSLPLILFLIWQVLLWHHTGTFNRLHHSVQLEILQNVMLILSGLGTWIVPKWHGVEIYLTLCMIVLTTIQIRKIIYTSAHILLPMVSILIYLLVLITKGDLSESDTERYLSIIYWPVLLIFFVGLKEYSRLNTFYVNYVKLSKITIVIWSVYPFVRLLKNVMFWVSEY